MTERGRAKVAASPDDEIICGCANLRRSEFQDMLAADPLLSFDGVLARTGAGTKCTACLLDLEHYYVTLPRNQKVGITQPIRGETAPPSFRQRLYRMLDRLSPQVPVPLTEWMPVLIGPGIEQWVWLANHSLLYEDKECPPDFDIGITVRHADGAVTYRDVHGLERGASLRLNISQFLDEPRDKADRRALSVGSVEISRRARQPGFRGTIRPQIEIVSPAGNCVLHSQAPGGPPEQWFTCLYRPRDERVFVSLVNASAGRLPVEVAYPFDLAGKDGEQSHIAFTIPAHGAHLHEIRLASRQAEDFLERPVGIRWRVSGSRKAHVICASPNLDRFSIDHL